MMMVLVAYKVSSNLETITGENKFKRCIYIQEYALGNNEFLRRIMKNYTIIFISKTRITVTNLKHTQCGRTTWRT